MIFVPIYSDDTIVRADAFDSEAAEVVALHPRDIAKGIAAANQALLEGRVTRDDLDNLGASSGQWPPFTKFIMDVVAPR